MRHVASALMLASVLGLLTPLVAVQQVAAPPAGTLTAVLEKLPLEWRGPAASIDVSGLDPQRLVNLPSDSLRVLLARMLARNPGADAFLKTQLVSDPSPAVRRAIVQTIGADARWLALPDTSVLIEGAVARDPDASVSLAALETLRRARMRALTALLNERVGAAHTRAEGASALAQLTDEQERWLALERGTMLPAFLRTPPPVFAAKPAEDAIRVLAFGDFGNGSPEQKTLAQTIATYHRSQRFDFALTLGDNFYSAGMESPTDPRWQSWFEQLYGPLGITFYASLGNHDWVHPDSPAAEILYSGKTATWRMPAAYYTFTAGPVQFFALDTQVIAPSEKQRQWLDAELARSTARWKVVYGHHPIYSGGNYDERPDLIRALLPILQNRADVYLCGHDHNLQALQPQDGVRFFIAGGGGAGLYDLREYERSLFASRSNGFAVLEADQTRLTVKFVDATGATVYEDTVRKDATASGRGR